MQETKVCRICLEKKDLKENFYPSPRNKGGYTTYCKECNTKRAAEKRKNNPNKFKGDRNVETKVCNKCDERKTLINFNLQPRNKDGHHHICRECKNKGDRDRNNKQRYDLWTKYGLTVEEYEQMKKDQDYRCKNAGCRRHESESTRGSLVVDHCHETGVVRGLLCGNCNSAEGMIGGCPERLLGMIEYLGFDLNEVIEQYTTKRK